MAINAVIQEEGGKKKIALDGIVITDCVLLEQKENSTHGYDLLLLVGVDRITEGRPGAWTSSERISLEALTGGVHQKTQSYSPCYPEARSP